MKYKTFELDRFQVEAIHALDKKHSVVVSAPTGSGKTLIAEYIINSYKGKIIYTAPIKALSNQKYADFSEEYGEERVGIMTGDVVKNPNADILIMTTEIYRNMALTQDALMDKVAYVIFDEIHYINDIERGYVWEESIIFSKEHVRFLCLSATIPNAREFAQWIEAIKGHTVTVVNEKKRHVPLEKKFFDSELGITTLADIKYMTRFSHGRRGKAPNHINLVREIQDNVPAMFFTLSRQKCEEHALQLARKKMFDKKPEVQSIVREKLRGAPKEVKTLKSTKTLLETLSQGIAFHHAGLLPVIKELVETLFSKGLINVLYTTETFAVGINMPAKTVCFESLRKYDGISFRYLNSKEYFQIAGRAGRRGIDTKGYSYAMIARRDFDYQTIKNITDADTLPIKSQFRLSVNTVLNMIKNHTKKDIEIILRYNFFTFQKYGKRFRTVKKNIFMYSFLKTKKKLSKLGYLKDEQLTEKGEFARKIYADEILTSELFATPFYRELSEYQILLLVAALSYEHREKTEIYKKFWTAEAGQLKKKVFQAFSKEKQFRRLRDITAFIHPCYNNKTLFDVLSHSNLSEGDIIRFFRQILDRMNQIKQATGDERLRFIMKALTGQVHDFLRDIDVI